MHGVEVKFSVRFPKIIRKNLPEEGFCIEDRFQVETSNLPFKVRLTRKSVRSIDPRKQP